MRAALLLLLALAATACRRAEAPAVGADRVRFAHGPHLRAGQTCLACHARVVTPEPGATGARRRGLPTEAECLTCHTRPAERACAYCHSEPRNPRTYAPNERALVFSHGPHVARERGGCVSCHAAGADATTVRRFDPGVPTMDTCASRCHGDDMRAMRCDRCHESLARYGVDALSLVRHGPGFARRHGAEARAATQLCAQCHDPDHCARCHNPSAGAPLADLEPMGVTRDFVHRGDFQARHAEEARLSQGSCNRCHGVDACNECHRASGIGGSVGPRATHPVGWLDPLSPRGHAREARRNLLACASCHEADAARTCAPCHREGGGAGNPHPPGFAAGLDRTQHAVCLACHTH